MRDVEFKNELLHPSDLLGKGSLLKDASVTMGTVLQPGLHRVPLIATHSFTKLLKLHREVLVGCIKNTECVLINLIKHEYISTEEAEMSQQHPTQAAKVRKILDLVESKGEETAEYFLHILYQAREIYADLSPWLKEIEYQPSEYILGKPVIITDAVCQYTQKIKHDLRQDTKFVTSYVQKEDILLDDTYTETLMELINGVNETKGTISNLEDLFSDTGIINEDAETVFVTGDAGVGKTILLQRLQNLWSKGELCADVKFFFKFRCRMFNSFREEDKFSLRDLLFKYNCYPDKDADEIFSYIRQHPDSVLFTLDGFDEISVDCDLSDIPDVSSPFDPTHPLTLLMNLLRGKLLKGSKKLLTARTGTNLPLRMVRKRVTLKGFTKDNLLQYLKKFFKNQPHQTLVLTQLEANPHLCSLCSVPLFCWIIFKCYKHLQSECNSQQILDYVTLTDIYLLMLEVFLNRSSKTGLNRRNKSQRSVQRKRSALKAYLADCVKLHLKNLPQAPFEEFCRVQVLPRFVWLMRYIFETQSEAVASLAAKGICADYIKLTFCNAFSADCSAIANILRHRKKSIALELDNNNINDYGVKELVPCFNKLTVVRLSVNQVTDDGAKVLAEELLKYKIIKILGLYRNQITDVGARFIAQVVEECPHLRTLKIGLNKLTSEGGKLLARAIQKSKAIKDIGMWGNQIGDVGAVAFAEAIRNHPSIKELSLAANGISTEGGKSLAAALQDNRSLEIFWLTENQLNDEAAVLFAEALRVNKSLLHLWIINNRITDMGANCFFEILKENATIEEICLNGNDISAEGAKRFAEEKRIVL
ncbi:nucleotide-binding oligomerization domain-containing protein 1 isoform X2 [Stegostoma tigrinum]|uniref:nucleotide-binding oligomerization domain-containing protein 1 isoform X2 n=1 Tax=Stegostoma tigrinum TaxID=3053191 RepID=UPI002870B366|nr:nucleotide-binding oligomerization domain-containing protein 1 isoform X2 [Stegostoma tigrinum]